MEMFLQLYYGQRQYWDPDIQFTYIESITNIAFCTLHMYLIIIFFPNTESNFLLNIVVTEHKQLQLWIELNAPLIAEVRAIVYFTPSHETTSQRLVTTRSVLTANTVMVFQLESHEIPDSIQEDDFLVQVALKVDTINGSLVPRELKDASTFSKLKKLLYSVHIMCVPARLYIFL